MGSSKTVQTQSGLFVPEGLISPTPQEGVFVCKMFLRHHRQPTAVLILKKTNFFASAFFNITPVIKQNRFEKIPKRGANKLSLISLCYSCKSLISSTPLKRSFSMKMSYGHHRQTTAMFILKNYASFARKNCAKSADFNQIIQNRFFIIRTF